MKIYKNEIIYPLDGWGIPMEMYIWIRENIKNNSKILELGSGPSSTGNLSQFYTMYSIEHDIKYVNKYNSTYIYAPIKDNWFDKDIIKHNIQNLEYCAILVDGPTKEGRRYGFITNINLFKTKDKPIIIDDVHRYSEQKLIEDISNILNRGYKIFSENKCHSFGIIY